MTDTMHAIRLTGPTTPNKMTVSEVPLPEVKPGWVRLRVKAFGVNESEVTSRKGESSPDFTFPRILGIEAAGVIDETAEGSAFTPGQTVITMMGGMGRAFDGSYADYTLVPETQVIPFTSDLGWDVIGALPEMFQTAYGSLTTGLDVRPGQTVLVRGGTSTVGLAAATLAHDLGATVISTTRNPAREALLREHGADHVVIDDGSIATKVRESALTESTGPSNSSACPSSTTPCAQCVAAAPSASQALSAESGPSTSSILSPSSPPACA